MMRLRGGSGMDGVSIMMRRKAEGKVADGRRNQAKPPRETSCPNESAEEAWRREIYRRLQEIDSGAVELIPWDDARRRLWARLEQ